MSLTMYYSAVTTKGFGAGIVSNIIFVSLSLPLQGDPTRWRNIPLRCSRVFRWAFRCYRWRWCYGNACHLHPLVAHEPGQTLSTSHQRPHSPQQEPGQHRSARLQCKPWSHQLDPIICFGGFFCLVLWSEYIVKNDYLMIKNHQRGSLWRKQRGVEGKPFWLLNLLLWMITMRNCTLQEIPLCQHHCSLEHFSNPALNISCDYIY